MNEIVKSCSIDGANIKYWVYGNPADTPLLLVHGFTGSHEGFQYIVPELKGFYIVVPDLPGFGESQLGSDQWGIDEIARRTNEFTKSLELTKKPHVIAHSMGGVAAASMLAQSPELYDDKTVFISPHVQPVGGIRKIGAAMPSLQYGIGKTLPRFGPKLVKSRLYSRVATKAIMTAREKSLKEAIYQHHFRNLEFISSINFYHNMHREIIKTGTIDYAEKLRHLDMLIITGNKDNVTPLAGQRRLQKELGAKLHIIPDVGHLLHYEKPKEVAAAIRAFLKP